MHIHIYIYIYYRISPKRGSVALPPGYGRGPGTALVTDKYSSALSHLLADLSIYLSFSLSIYIYIYTYI